MTSGWDAPTTDVYSQLDAVLAGDADPAVLVTVVGVDGNAYRRPGARMLVGSDGHTVGSVTAGCVEGAVRETVDTVLDTGTARLRRFDLAADDDVWGLGVGCDGVVDLLVEPVGPSARPLTRPFRDREPVTVVTAIDPDAPVRIGTRAVHRPQADGLDPGGWEDAPAGTAAIETAAREATGRRTLPGGTTVFVDRIRPPPRLYLFGTGTDVGPVVETAARAGFQVVVVGFRGGRATADRFPAATDVRSGSPAEVRSMVDVDDRSYAVVMTHDFVDDTVLVDELTRTDIGYLGLMGPSERFDRIREALAADGRTLSTAELAPIHTPIGLDLGSGTPHGIAISIVAELLAVDNGTEPIHLSDSGGPIHDRSNDERSRDGAALGGRFDAPGRGERSQRPERPTDGRSQS